MYDLVGWEAIQLDASTVSLSDDGIGREEEDDDGEDGDAADAVDLGVGRHEVPDGSREARLVEAADGDEHPGEEDEQRVGHGVQARLGVAEVDHHQRQRRGDGRPRHVEPHHATTIPTVTTYAKLLRNSFRRASVHCMNHGCLVVMFSDISSDINVLPLPFSCGVLLADAGDLPSSTASICLPSTLSSAPPPSSLQYMQSSMTMLTAIPTSMAGRIPMRNLGKVILLLKAMTSDINVLPLPFSCGVLLADAGDLPSSTASICLPSTLSSAPPPSSLQYMQSSMTMLTAIPTSMAGRIPMRNLGKVILLLKAMTRFWGLPMGVAAEPMLALEARARRKGLAGRLRSAASSRTNSVRTTQQVSLVKRALARAVTTQTRHMRSRPPWLFHASRRPRCLNIPAFRR
uniref:Uncharacterized protein n=1 Tax=Oryza meridionalis TaxID=40149 RepID=A0A0E0CTR3_9ORYZ